VERLAAAKAKSAPSKPVPIQQRSLQALAPTAFAFAATADDFD
jgi:hypothetical protein